MDTLETILLISADPTLRAALDEIGASHHAWRIAACATAAEAKVQLRDQSRQPNCVLLDVDLPDQDGYALCHTLNDVDGTPLIMLLARGAGEADVVRGLEAGASSFVSLPVGSSELRARVATLLRLQAQRLDATLRIGSFVVQPAEGKLLQGARLRSRLTAKEIAILRFLHRAGGVPVSRYELLRAVWNYSEDADTHTIETHIYRLRKKFGDLDRDAHPIKTSRDGYRLTV